MNIDWLWLGVAILLLAPPPPLSGELRRILSSVRRSESVEVGGIFKSWQNWLDLLRAAAGTAVLMKMAIWAEIRTEGSGTRVFILQLAVLIGALLLQIVRRNATANRPEQKWQIMAPVCYLSGVTVALSGASSGLFAVVAGWLFAIATKNPQFQLPIMWIALAAGGFVFGKGLALYGNLSLILFPLCAAFVLRKRMVFLGLVRRFPAPPVKPGLSEAGA